MRKKGFSLVEVLIASAILFVISGAFLNSLTQCSNLTEIDRSEDIALTAAQGWLEQIARSDLSQVMTFNGQAFDAAGLTPPAGFLRTGSIAVSRIGTTSLYDIVVTVRWLQKGRTVTRSLTRTVVRR